MTTPARTTHSAYPPAVAELVPAARRLAARLGETPSRNKLMAELHIGAKKANQLRDVLTEPEPGRLHLVSEQPVPNADDQASTEPEPDTPSEPNEAPEPVGADPAVPGEAEAGPATAVVSGPAALAQAEASADPGTAGTSAVSADTTVRAGVRRVPVWPVLLLTLPALAAIWSGWVSLGAMAGFGIVHPLPGIADHVTFNTAITLPIGVETYAAYALYAWLSGAVPAAARRFAKRSAIASLMVGALGQVAYHLLSAAHVAHAPWPITTVVACLPVAVLGMGAALAHLIRSGR